MYHHATPGLGGSGRGDETAVTAMTPLASAGSLEVSVSTVYVGEDIVVSRVEKLLSSVRED